MPKKQTKLPRQKSSNCIMVIFQRQEGKHCTVEPDEPCHEKTNVLVSDLVLQKPGCTATEDGQRLEISDLGSRGIVLSM